MIHIKEETINYNVTLHPRINLYNYTLETLAINAFLKFST